jgi:hypothetical protein
VAAFISYIFSVYYIYVRIRSEFNQKYIQYFYDGQSWYFCFFVILHMYQYSTLIFKIRKTRKPELESIRHCCGSGPGIRDLGIYCEERM